MTAGGLRKPCPHLKRSTMRSKIIVHGNIAVPIHEYRTNPSNLPDTGYLMLCRAIWFHVFCPVMQLCVIWLFCVISHSFYSCHPDILLCLVQTVLLSNVLSLMNAHIVYTYWLARAQVAQTDRFTQSCVNLSICIYFHLRLWGSMGGLEGEFHINQLYIHNWMHKQLATPY